MSRHSTNSTSGSCRFAFRFEYFPVDWGLLTNILIPTWPSGAIQADPCLGCRRSAEINIDVDATCNCPVVIEFKHTKVYPMRNFTSDASNRLQKAICRRRGSGGRRCPQHTCQYCVNLWWRRHFGAPYLISEARPSWVKQWTDKTA